MGVVVIGYGIWDFGGCGARERIVHQVCQVQHSFWTIVSQFVGVMIRISCASRGLKCVVSDMSTLKTVLEQRTT